MTKTTKPDEAPAPAAAPAPASTIQVETNTTPIKVETNNEVQGVANVTIESVVTTLGDIRVETFIGPQPGVNWAPVKTAGVAEVQ